MFSLNISKINFEEEIGEGAQSTVYAYHHPNNKNEPAEDKYVVKRITTPKIETMLLGIQEIVMGFSCDHPNVLPIKGYHIAYEKNSKLWDIYIKMPRMETSLKSKIDQYARAGKTFSEEEIIKHFYSLILGLRHLHGKNIAHRDIKPDNILIDRHGTLKIADIGIGKLVGEDEKTEMLTLALGVPLYTAPEVLSHASELKKRGLFLADVWSLGVIMAEMCVPRTRLVDTKATGKANEANLTQILRGLQGRYNKVLLELICGMLKAEPSERKSLEEIQRALEEHFADVLKLEVKESAAEVIATLNEQQQKEMQALKRYIEQEEEEKQALKTYIEQQEAEKQTLKRYISDLEKQIQEMHVQIERLELFNKDNDKMHNMSDMNAPVVPVDNNVGLHKVSIIPKDQEIKSVFPKETVFRTLSGHKGDINCIELLHPGGLASCSDDNTIRIWNLQNDQCVKILEGHTNVIWSLKMLTADKLASGSTDCTIKIWDLKTGTCQKTLKGHTNIVKCLALLPTGELASCSNDETIKIWNFKTGHCLKTLKGHSRSVCTISFFPRVGLVSGSVDQTIKIWDATTLTCVATLAGHTDVVRSFQLLRSGELASACDDNTIKIWNLAKRTCIMTLTGHTAYVLCLEISSKGELISGSADTTIKIWNIKTQECVMTLEDAGWVSSLKQLPTGELASCSNRDIKIWANGFPNLEQASS